MRSVLLVAYHYPPEGSSSGVQRTLTFSRYLGENGWCPVVLSADPRSYKVTREDQLSDIPDDVVVHRAFALDTGRHLAVAGRYPRFAALPDRWVSWCWGAMWSGMRLIRKHRPAVLWSTYPIATAHLVGYWLHRLSGLPWVADFRDSMTEEGYPRNPAKWRSYRSIEKRTVHRASCAVFTAPGAAAMYRERYPDVDPSRYAVIPNGYDETSFSGAEALRSASGNGTNGSGRHRVVLLHSGILYPSERDPRAFYRAVARLSRDGVVSPQSLRIVLRSTGHDKHHRRLIDENGIGDLVTLAPRTPYREALREMLDVDGLLLFQGSNCNHQVPAKVYEYFRARRPILALTAAEGDTAGVLREANLDAIAPLDDEERIAAELTRFLADLRAGRARVAADDEVRRHSRTARTRALAELLDAVAAEASA